MSSGEQNKMPIQIRHGMTGMAIALLAAALTPGLSAATVAQTPARAAAPWQIPIVPHSRAYARLEREARQVTITRDNWGIAHVHGRTDADAVFGAVYAQCEDDFSRVRRNYLLALGWNAQAMGRSRIWQDLREQLFIDPAVLKQDYVKSPAWLRRLMDAWADGMNWYLATHPATHGEVIKRYLPWMALSFTEGSIGGDITRVKLSDLAAFYGGRAATVSALAVRRPPSWYEQLGSNGIAIAPKLTVDHHALLLINPHVTFNFRDELQMSSDQGLDAYGAATWKERARLIEEVCMLFPRLRERIGQLAGTLSGGERQMLATARALMARPRLLMLDEPSLGLAPKIIEAILAIIQDINRRGVAVLLVEQNAQLALRAASRAYLLEAGTVLKFGATVDFLADESVRRSYLGI